MDPSGTPPTRERQTEQPPTTGESTTTNNYEPSSKRPRTDSGTGAAADTTSATTATSATTNQVLMAPDPTALAADIAAVLPVTPTPDAANREAVAAAQKVSGMKPAPASGGGTTTTTTTTTTTNRTTATPQVPKAEIQAALEKVKEDNLKKEPSISTLVTEGLWDDDPRVVEDALTKVANLSYGNANAGPNRVTISLTGGLLAIVKALQKFSKDPEVQAAGGRALQNLALDQNNKSGIASSGGINMLVKAMKEFPNHEGVQLGGCGTFQNLIWGNDGNRLQILKAGGIPVLVNAINQHADATELLEWACGAVYLLSVGEKEVRDALFEHHALSAVATALENNRGEGGLLEKGRNALARLLWP